MAFDLKSRQAQLLQDETLLFFGLRLLIRGLYLGNVHFAIIDEKRNERGPR